MDDNNAPNFDDIDADRIIREGTAKGNAQTGIDAERASLNAMYSPRDDLQAVINGDSSNVGVSAPFGVAHRIEPPAETEENSWGERASAFFQTENTFVSNEAEFRVPNHKEIGYVPMDDPLTKAYPHLIGQFIHSVSNQETMAIIANDMQETKNREVVANTSMLGTFGYTALATVLDPVLAPAMVYTGGTGLLVQGGRGVAMTAAKVSGFSMANETIAEIMKHDSQRQRTAMESAITIGGVGIFSVIGSGVSSKLLLKKMDKASKEYAKVLFEAADHGSHVQSRDAHINKVMRGEGESIGDVGETGSKSASAAQTKKMFADASDEDAWKYELKPILGFLSGNKFFEKVGLTKWRVNPLIRMSQSRIAMVRMLAPMLADSPYFYKGHEAGEAITSGPSIENLRMRDTQETVRVMAQLNDIYLKHVQLDGKLGGMKSLLRDYTGKTGELGHKTLAEFKSEVTRALRNGGNSDDAAVSEASKLVREQLLKPMLERGIKAGVLDDGLRAYADSYVPRMWDFERIAAESYDQKDGLADKIFSWYKQQQVGYKEKYEELLNYQKTLDSNIKLEEPAYESMKPGAEAYDDVRATAHDLKKLARFNIDLNDPAQVKQLLREEAEAGMNVKSLAGYIRARGGIKESGGELAATGIDNKSYPGLVSEYGDNWEHSLESAFEEGYFTGYAKWDDISESEFLEALHADAVLKDRIYTSQVTEHPDFQQAFEVSRGEAGELLSDLNISQTSKVTDIHDSLYKKMHDVTFSDGKQTLKESLSRNKAFRAANEIEINGYSAFARMTDQQIRDLAHKTVDNIRGLNVDQLEDVLLPDHTAFKAGPLKDRRLQMSDLDLEDYLVSDIDKISHSYVRGVAPQMAVADRFGDIHMTETFEQLFDAYKNIKNSTTKEMREAGASEKSITKEMQKIDKEMESDKKDILALRDKLYGNYNRPADPDGWINRSRETVLAVNFMRLLGGMTISAIGDLARPVMEHGLANTMSTAMRLVSSKDMRLMAKDELQAMGIMLESVGLNSVNRFGDLTEYASSRSKYEANLGAATAAFSKASLMPMWNDTLKGVAAMTMQNNMIKILKAGDISQGNIEKFARLGFSKDELPQLKALMDKYAEDANGLWLSNATKWDDIVELEDAVTPGGTKYTRKVFSANGTDLSQRWQAAVRKNANEMIVTPGVGDMPLFMSGPNARILMQFKSFAVSSHSRVLISVLQKQDKAALEGVIFAVFLGFLTGEVKNALNGRERPDDMGDLIYDAVDRSGLMGMLPEMVQTASTATGGLLNPAQLWGSDRATTSRMQSRNLTGQLIGPTGDLVQDLVTTTATMGRFAQGEDATEGEKRTAAKFMPGASLFYFKALMRAFDEAGD